MKKYSRENPSPKHLELLEFYKTMHNEGYNVQQGDSIKRLAADQTYPGRMLPRFIQPIQQMVKIHKSKTVLDYGAGKGLQYQLKDVKDPEGNTHADIQTYWQVESIKCYDPAFEAFSTLPDEKSDAVVSTDVLEHCSPTDVPWIVTEMFSLAKQFLFVNINCMPAAALLPNGENAHVMIRHPEWWYGLFSALGEDFPDIDFLLCCIANVVTPESKGKAEKKSLFYRRKVY